jgi:hypothetical protein
MSILTILLFFLYSYGFGLLLSSYLKNSKNFLERNLMRIGLGIGVFIVLGTIMGVLGIPIDWKIFLLLSLIGPVIWLVKKNRLNKLNVNEPSSKFKLNKENLNIIILLVIFVFCLFMYIGGSFAYPFLENDDPWSHAEGVQYIANEKSIFDTSSYDIPFVDPYPPGYDLFLAVMYQTNDSLNWTLKFFNGLIISLGIIFFYFFTKRFLNSRNKALFATFVLATMPAYFTHFIWAHSLAIMLFFPTMYCLEMIKNDKKWIYPSMVLLASIMLTQPSQAIKLGVMILIYVVIKSIKHKELIRSYLKVSLGALILSLFWWATKILSMIGERVNVVTKNALKAGVNDTITEASALASQGIFTKIKFLFANYLSPDLGTATRAYSFNDFFVAKPFGGINVHVGLGIAISILLIIGLIFILYKYKTLLKQEWMSITLLWFLFTFLGTNSMTFGLPIGFFAFRFWLIMAIPVAILSAVGLNFIYAFFGNKKQLKKIILITFIILIIVTAAIPKYKQNTSPNWYSGARWTSGEEIMGFVKLSETIPKNSKVFSYTVDDKYILGFDMQSCFWCNEVIDFRKDLINRTPDDLYTLLKNHNYEYVLISGMTYRYLGKKYSEEGAQQNVKAILDFAQTTNKLSFAYQNEAVIVLKVN